MARTALAEANETLELGSMKVLYRPRSEGHEHDLSDVERLLILLRPEGSPFERVIAIGRNRLPAETRRDRFWGFVDLVLTPFDMAAALEAHVFHIESQGLRHVPAARAFAWGHYDLTSHDDHSHLRWQIERRVAADADSPAIEASADYIVSVANPDPTAWGLLEPPDLQSQLFDELELHVTLPQSFPPSLQKRFDGRPFTALDSAAWLDHPGAEILFADAGE